MKIKNFSQDSQPLGQDLNPEPPTYEAGGLNTWLQHSVRAYQIITQHNYAKTCGHLNQQWLAGSGYAWFTNE
jgi:hypothetical protein